MQQEPQIPIVAFDCSIMETHSRESVVTEFETENGDTISDHIVVKPFNLHIQGIVSNSPLSSLAGLATAAVTTVATAVAPPVGVLGKNAAALAALPLIPNPFAPANTAYQSLLNLQNLKLPFTVQTTLYTYKNMWVKKLSVPRDAQRGNAVFFELDLVQLLLVTPTTVNIGQFAAADLAASQSNKGEQSATGPSSGVVANYNAGLAGNAPLPLAGL
jgi:hypothetical protein